jgi:hypothetical protein
VVSENDEWNQAKKIADDDFVPSLVPFRFVLETFAKENTTTNDDDDDGGGGGGDGGGLL